MNNQAPQFQLKNTTGNLVSLDSFKGKWVVINPQGIIRYSYIGKSFTDRPSNDNLIQELQKQSQRLINITLCL